MPVSEEVLLSEAEYPLYVDSIDNESTIKLYFADETTDIPYIDIDTSAELIIRMYHEMNEDEGFQLTVSEDENSVTLTRENRHTMIIDSEKDTISFEDFDGFFAPSWSDTVIDTLEHYGTIDYIQIDKIRSYDRSGTGVEFELGKYGIDIIKSYGKCYIPLQTLSDIVLSLPCYTNLIYNGKAVFANEFTGDDDNELFASVYEAETGMRSRALADFTYAEFCMVMDHFYGQKEKHGIQDFDEFFLETGLKDRLLSQDPKESSDAFSDACFLYLDDLHSIYLHNSYLAGADYYGQRFCGSSYASKRGVYKRLKKARDAQYPDGIPGYEEIDNTAYITFDVFSTIDENADYYKNAPTADTTDTVGRLLYAFNQITRKDSPVENVVFDLSYNVGGDQTTGGFMLGMVLGRASMTLEDTMTGAYVRESFMADANLDGKFDEKDSLAGYNLFCIISPGTFSFGNWVASELKDSNIVTMLGQRSGGGTCVVIPLSLADGTCLTTSSCRRQASIKNGALYDIDLGIEPDLYIGKPSALYDREELTRYINSNVH